MKVYVLIENTTDSALAAEHGLSLFIEFDGVKILLDAGTTDAFIGNASQMNVDISSADYCVLSHGHYDHSGGFAGYLTENPEKRIYAMEAAIDDYYSGSGGHIHQIGIPKAVYPEYKDNFVFVSKATKIGDKVYLIPHTTQGLGIIGERAKLYKKIDEQYTPDDFSHEMSLVLDTDKGLVIFNSCSHSGIVNICEEVKSYFDGKKIYAFFGGLHMKGKRGDVEICTFSENEIVEITSYLKQLGLSKLYTGHCTGMPGYELIRKYMGEQAQYITTGKQICI